MTTLKGKIRQWGRDNPPCGKGVCLLSRVLPDSMCDVVGTLEGTPSECVRRYAGKYVDPGPGFMKTDSWGSKTHAYYFTAAAAKGWSRKFIHMWLGCIDACGIDGHGQHLNVAVAQWKLLLYSDGASHKATRTEFEKRHGLGTRMSITMSKSTDSLTRRGTDIEGNMVLTHFVKVLSANDRYKP